MTIGEATALNAVLTYMLGAKRGLDIVGVKPDIALDIESSAVLLADRAHKVLGAGLHGRLVRELWAGKELSKCSA